MITLHHNDMSSCSQKVRFVLEEKKIPWTSEELNLRGGDQFREEYVALNPKAVVPTLIQDRDIVVESAVISQFLDESFPGRSMTPDNALDRARMRLWIQLIDEYLHADISVISHAIVFADEIRAANNTEEKLAKYLSSIPDVDKRDLRRELVTKSTDAKPFKSSLWRYKKFVTKMCNSLSETPYLLGNELTLADVVCLPYIVRFIHLNQANLIDDLPNMTNWYKRMFDTDGYRNGLEKWFKPAGIENMMRAGELKRAAISAAWQEAS